MEGTTAASETKYGVFAVSDADATDKITFGLLHQDGTTVSWGENGTEAVLYLIKGPSGPEVTNIPPIMDGSSATLNNYYGKIAINADAADSRSSHYSLEVYNNSSAINELNQGQKLPLTFTVVAGDQHGAYATQTIDTTITGTNDAPSFNGVYSKVYLRDDGVHATDKFTVQVSDENGGVTQKEITITFEGKNNVPTGTDAFIAIQEDTELTPTTSSWMGDLIKVQDDRGTANLSFTVSHSEDSAGGMGR